MIIDNLHSFDEYLTKNNLTRLVKLPNYVIEDERNYQTGSVLDQVEKREYLFEIYNETSPPCAVITDESGKVKDYIPLKYK